MSLRNSWDAIDAPRATTPPPPLYQRRRPQDRSSISSVLTTSTTASSIIVSPTTPTKQEWAPVRIASPTLGKGREWQGRDSWGSMSEDENLGTPRSGSFLDVKVPQTSKGSHAESQSWWAGTTPTVQAPELGQRDIDTARMSQCSISSLQIDSEGSRTEEEFETPLDESPTLGRLELEPSLDDASPTLEIPEEDSPIIPAIFSALPMPPVRRARVQRRPSARTYASYDASMTIDFSRPVEGWSARRLGKLPDTPNGQRLKDDLVSNAPYLSRQSSSSSLTSTNSGETFHSTASLPSIPIRKSSRGVPPTPPARTSSLETTPAASSSLCSALSAFPSLPPRPAGRSVSGPASGSRPITPPTSASLRSLKRHSTASSRISLLETVPELPRDLDIAPDPAWALRTRPRRLRKSRSEPDLHDHLPGTMMQRLRIKRADPASNKLERRKSVGACLSPVPRYAEDVFEKDGSKWTASMRKSENIGPGFSDQRPIVGPPPPTARVAPQPELSFIPSRPAPRPPTVTAVDRHNTIVSPADFVKKVGHYKEPLNSVDSASHWSHVNLSLPVIFASNSRPSTIKPSTSEYTLEGPLIPRSSGLPPCLPPVPDLPADLGKMSERDLLHGELEFELAEERRQRMAQRQNIMDFGLPVDYSSKRMSLAPAWQGRAF